MQTARPRLAPSLEIDDSASRGARNADLISDGHSPRGMQAAACHMIEIIPSNTHTHTHTHIVFDTTLVWCLQLRVTFNASTHS